MNDVDKKLCRFILMSQTFTELICKDCRDKIVQEMQK